MAQRDDPREDSYPIGRGYGHDYLRGGEVLGGYGYSARPDYERRRGDSPHPDDASTPQRPSRMPASQPPGRPRATP